MRAIQAGRRFNEGKDKALPFLRSSERQLCVFPFGLVFHPGVLVSAEQPPPPSPPPVSFILQVCKNVSCSFFYPSLPSSFLRSLVLLPVTMSFFPTFSPLFFKLIVSNLLFFFSFFLPCSLFLHTFRLSSCSNILS